MYTTGIPLKVYECASGLCESLHSIITGFFLYIISRGCVVGGEIGGVWVTWVLATHSPGGGIGGVWVTWVLATHSHHDVSNDTSKQKRHTT